MFGGYKEDFSISDSIYEFNPVTGQWSTSPAKMATPRGDLQAVATATGDNGADIFILGGVISLPGVNCDEES